MESPLRANHTSVVLSSLLICYREEQNDICVFAEKRPSLEIIYFIAISFTISG